MGREARANANLTPLERWRRRLARSAKGMTSCAAVERSFWGIGRADRERILQHLRPLLGFTPTDDEWKALRRKLGVRESDAPDDATANESVAAASE
jgi:hypothetical protein